MSRLSRFDILSACNASDEVSRPVKQRGYRKPPNRLSKPSVGPVIRTTSTGKTVRVWTDALDTAAWKQAAIFANLPIVHPHGLALMPDIHPGHGVPVGCVLPTVNALVPAAVGVDIGCGMLATRLDLHARDLPKDLSSLRCAIESRVGISREGQHIQVPDSALMAWSKLSVGQEWMKEKHSAAMLVSSAPKHMGTLGGGNHFIEVCLDRENVVWIMLHTGSRGIGAAIGRYFMNLAQRRVQENGGLTPSGLGWFDSSDPLFFDYARAVAWAQDVARVNRELLLQTVIVELSKAISRPVNQIDAVVSCHHNYVSCEHHFGEDVWITRKGAISAKKGEMGIIPSAMGKESLIVSGKGNPDSWNSCSHGAGRALSRSAAKERFTVEDFRQQTSGLECRKVRGLVDEIPSAYKPLSSVMANQRDLVEVRHRIRAVLCVKSES